MIKVVFSILKIHVSNVKLVDSKASKETKKEVKKEVKETKKSTKKASK